jgi:hypothetical protein
MAGGASALCRAFSKAHPDKVTRPDPATAESSKWAPLFPLVRKYHGLGLSTRAAGAKAIAEWNLTNAPKIRADRLDPLCSAFKHWFPDEVVRSHPSDLDAVNDDESRDAFSMGSDEETDQATQEEETDPPLAIRPPALSPLPFDASEWAKHKVWPGHYEIPGELATKTAAKVLSTDGTHLGTVAPARAIANVNGVVCVKTVLGKKPPAALCEWLAGELGELFYLKEEVTPLTHPCTQPVVLCMPKAFVLRDIVQRAADQGPWQEIWETQVAPRFCQSLVELAQRGLAFKDGRVLPNWAALLYQGQVRVFPIDLKLCEQDAQPDYYLSLIKDKVKEVTNWALVDAYLSSQPPRGAKRATSEEPEDKIPSTVKRLRATIQQHKDKLSTTKARYTGGLSRKAELVAEAERIRLALEAVDSEQAAAALEIASLEQTIGRGERILHLTLENAKAAEEFNCSE